LESIPSSSAAGDRLRPIAGQPPSLIRLPSGCAFHPRCEFAMDRCRREQPELTAVDDGTRHTSACWLPGHLLGTTEEMKQARRDASAAGRTVDTVPGQSVGQDSAVEEGAA
jgi:oligopeptide/dipeptide ABC transporter ATP-binding protein